MPQREYFRLGIRAAHERIVRRDGAVVLQAQHLAAVRVGVLRIVAAHAHVDGAVPAESQAGGAGSFRYEDIFRFGELRAVPTRSR